MAEIGSIDQFTIEVENRLKSWVTDTTALLIRGAKAQKLELTGDLINSFRSSVTKELQQQFAEGNIYFKQYGRYKDMKRAAFRSMPPVAVFEAYVAKVGVSNFRYVPGYIAGRYPSQEVAIKRIAWALAKSRVGMMVGGRQWFSKNFYKALADLQRKITFDASEFTSKAMAQDVQFKFG